MVWLVLALVASPACSRNSGNAAYMTAAVAAIATKDYARAIPLLDQAKAADVHDAEPYYRLALIYLDAGDGRRALEELQHATSLNPRHISAQLKLAELLAGSDRKDVIRDAQTRLTDLLRDSPNNVDILHGLALLEWKLGNNQHAEEHLRAALKARPDSVDVNLALVNLEISRGDEAGAE